MRSAGGSDKSKLGTNSPSPAQRHDAAVDSSLEEHVRSYLVRMDVRALFIASGALIAISSGCAEPEFSVQSLQTVHVERVMGQLRTVTSFRASEAEDQMIRLEYVEVDCETGARVSDSLAASAVVRTAPSHITPGIPGLEDLPLDHGSKHRFSDHLQTLSPGCFDVIATPVDASGAVDPRCKSAKRSKVLVQEGKTDEIVLINQCERTGTGGLDSIVVRNHPPQVIDVSFENGKFGQCSQDVVACATATDPDGDPMRFAWSQIPTSAPTLAPGTIVLQSVVESSGTRKECIRYRPTGLGRFDLKIEVFDQGRLNGVLRDFAELTEESHVSKAELDFFFYAMPDAGIGGGKDGAASPGQDKSGILILASSVVDGEDSEEAFAARTVLDKLRLGASKDALGNAAPVESVEVLDATEWSKKSRRDFSRYRAIIIGDPDCGDTPPEIPKLWTSAVNGNVLIYGSNPSRHGRLEVIEKAIEFATSDATRTGAYISTSCYYHSAPSQTLLDWIGPFGERGAKKTEEREFRVVHAGGCPNSAKVRASFDLDVQGNGSGFSDALLSNWGCSAHNFFQKWPSNFEPMALMTDYGSFSRVTGYPGEPFVLARGAHPDSCGNGIIEIGEDCDDGNREDGDLCDHACHTVKCGDGILQGKEYCDDGNTENGDGCSSSCSVEPDPCQG